MDTKKIDIESADFSTRAYNVLKRSGINFVEDIDQDKLDNIRGCGKRTKMQIIEKCEELIHNYR